MNPEKFEEAQWLQSVRNNEDYQNYRNEYLQYRPSFTQFIFPKYFYFKILNDRLAIHWAVIKQDISTWIVYFINAEGRAFDKLEFRTKKRAQRALRRNGFYFSTNKKCPYLPLEKIYVRFHYGKKSTPYSHPLGRLWDYERKKQPCIVFEKKEKIYSEIDYISHIIKMGLVVVMLILLNRCTNF